MAYRVTAFKDAVIALRSRRRGVLVLAYREVLTAERMRGRRSRLRLRVRTSDPLIISCGNDREWIEFELRARGVRIVDPWGCMITPTLEDFETELMNKPAVVRQSYDDA